MLVEANRHEALAAALKTLWEQPDLLKRMRHAAQVRALERFSWERNAKDLTEAIFRTIHSVTPSE
jgi:glycosyltransferase involved in cell wall biosynthesis